MKFTYTYKIEKIDVTSGCFLVKYLPDDSDLTAETYNLPVAVELLDGKLCFDMEAIIDECSPQEKWRAQKYLLQNMDSFLNKTGKL